MSVAGIRGRPDGEGLAYDTFRSSAEFPTDDILRRDQLTKLGDRLVRFLPETRMQTVDLRTREVWSEQSMPLDPVIADWCREGTDRWLSIKLGENDRNWIGLRPKQE